VNYGLIPPAKARELLATYAQVVRVVISSPPSLPHGLERDDLKTYAEMAVLEAHITHDSANGGEKTWVQHIVRWRVGEAIKRAYRPEVPTDQAHTWVNGAGPEAKFAIREQRMWLESKIGLLSPRESNVIALRLRGERSVDIAATIGVSKGRVAQNAADALRTLHEWACQEGLGPEEPSE
jgi:RNA polymerase sigma factor (sigma-70 family)